MDVVSLLQSFETILFELALLPIFLFKTLFKVVFTPHWIQKYVTEEWEKTEENTATEGNNGSFQLSERFGPFIIEKDTSSVENKISNSTSKRFDGYLSPLLFFILTGLIPFYLWFESTDSSAFPSDFSFGARLIFVALAYSGWPVGFTLIIQLFRRKPLRRNSLKPIFYAQCYCFGVAFLFISIIALITNNGSPTLGPSGIVTLVFALWFLLAETLVMSSELGIGRVRAALYTIIAVVASTIYLLLVAFAAIGVLSWLSNNKLI